MFSGREHRREPGRPDGAVLPDEQRRAGPARPAARGPDLGSRDPLRAVERHLAPGRLTLVALRARGHLDLGQGPARGGRASGGPYSYDIHGIVDRDLRGPAAGARAVPGRWARRLSRTSESAWAASPRTATAGRSRRSATARARAASGSGVAIEIGRDRSRRRPPRWSGARRTCSTRTWSSRSCAGPSPSGLRARARRLPRGRRGAPSCSPRAPTPARRPRASAARQRPVLVPLRRPHARDAPTAGCWTYPKPLTISRHTLKAVKTPLLTRRERRAWSSRAGCTPARAGDSRSILAATHLPAATINAVVQLLVPPPKYHVERLVPGVEVAPRGADRRDGRHPARRHRARSCSTSAEALETLMSNCEDAFGFPPYSAIEGSLRRRERERPAGTSSGRSWRSALSGLPPACCAARRWTGGVGCRAWSATGRPRPRSMQGRHGSRSVASPRQRPRGARARRRARHPSAAAQLAADARPRRRAAGLAAQRRGLQQRRGRLLGPGGGDRGRTRSWRTSSRSSAPTRFCSRPFSRSAGGSTSDVGFERFACRGGRRRDRLPGLRARAGCFTAGGRACVAALLMALMPYHVVVTRQVLLDGPMTLFADPHAAPARALRPQQAAGVAVRGRRRRWASPSSSKETSIVLLVRRLRVPRAHAGAARAAARPRHLAGRDGRW